MGKKKTKYSENEISEEILRSLNTKVSALTEFSKIEIDLRRQILIGTTCGVLDNELQLIFQTAEQDIVVYLKEEVNSIDLDNDKLLSRFSRSLPENKVLIPLLIFEVKHKSVITHSVRNYSEIARSIKSIFPFCMYNLLLLNFENPKEGVDKIYMASKNFDRIIYEPDYSNKYPEEVVNEILIIIEQHIEYLKNDKFFRLGKFLV